MLSVAVIDPAESGERQRIGLWRFSADQLRGHAMRSDQPQTALIPLELPWNLNDPRHVDLTLFARWQHHGSAPEEISQSFRVQSAAPNAESPELEISEDVAELTEDSDQHPRWQPDRR
jgi:hypothetical protein